MIHLVLVQPEIPANTGNISRTCAVTGCHLHLIRPLGFRIDDAAVRRAGLDYWPRLSLQVHDSLDDLFARYPIRDLWLSTTKASRSYHEAHFRPDCWIFFGRETAGLPADFRLAHQDRCIRIPMRARQRSLNLSNSVAIVAYEALRQLDFPGLHRRGEGPLP